MNPAVNASWYNIYASKRFTNQCSHAKRCQGNKFLCVLLEHGMNIHDNGGGLKNNRIIEVNLSAFVYRLFHRDFFPIVGTNIQ